MTDQPRDLAAEVEEIQRMVSAKELLLDEWGSALLLHIAALSRELEEHGEALRWAIENGAHTSTKGLCVLEEDGYSSNAGPPAHLAPILAEAMKEKS